MKSDYLGSSANKPMCLYLDLKLCLVVTLCDTSLYYYQIAAPPIPGAKEPKPVVYFEGGIHAREWISPATVMYFTAKVILFIVELKWLLHHLKHVKQ